MPRPLWSGAVSFGLVTIPVKIISATEDRDVHFHQIHRADNGRVRVRKTCALDGRELSQEEIGRGYEVSKDTIVEIKDEELQQLPLPTAKAIEVVAFVPVSSIDPVRFGDPYYLAADGPVAAKPYVLLRKALERTSKVAVIKMAWHGRERLGLLRVVGDAIALQTMYWPDEVRSPAGLAPKEAELTEKEIQEAGALMDAIGEKDIGEFHDEYRAALEAVIEAKAEGRRLPEVPEEAPPAGGVVDLMAALQQSVRKAREARGEGGEGGDRGGAAPGHIGEQV
ncbi:Ku protein, partial [Streptomyces sp. GC420]|uniref:non-homologous end joining protein Ku n=1 Tax=Streptomyces sp. GC420 TaxID=2697568 RepID=UPI00141517F0